MIHTPTPENIERAALLISGGELVAFPTETVYGLGADATNSSAVRKIFELKGRPLFNPLIVHLADIEQIVEVAQIDDQRMWRRLDLLKRFWPGPLSVVIPKKHSISHLVTAGLDTVAIRVPSHPVARELLRKSGRPIAAPSANRSNAVSPTSAQHVLESFEEQGVFILDGGNCEVGLESTIVSLVGDVAELLRPGGVTAEELRSTLGDIKVHPRIHVDGQAAPAPGMLPKHYAPKTPLVFKDQLQGMQLPNRTGLITFYPEGSKIPGAHFERVLVLSENGSLIEVANRLFAAMRELDHERLDLIVVDSCKKEGIGLAIMDRLGRAVTK